ncbi:MAG TPA: LysR substrate-binding domain-containing protein [Stellaceae bacterium]|jgi:LysR family pca operon transcriptional activator|nr:LysR substrate-binding domain-containing protein [Stellaceae bacterium]
MKVARFLDQKLRMRQMRFLEALDQHRSLSKAARALHMSQPALTKALHELETVIGETLFERHARGVMPTAAGRLILGFATRTLAELGRLDADLDHLKVPGGGVLHLGALPVSAAGLLPHVVRDLRQLYPHLELRLFSGRGDELLVKLGVGEIDMVLGRLYPPEVPDGFLREPIYDEPISLIARSDHPIFDMASGQTPESQIAGNHIAGLAGYDLVLPTFGQRLGQEIEHLLVTLGLTASPRTIRSASHLFIREVLHLTDMITLAPRMLVAGDIIRGTLRVLPVVIDQPRPAGLILNPAKPPSPTAMLLVDAIRRTAGRLTDSEAKAITLGYT